jgi:RNA polymerase sigma-70 factor (ECF subfamily)
MTEVLARARAGDRAAMESLLATVAPTIRRFAMRMCKNEADADDTLQDALLAIATELAGYEGRSTFSSWAFAVARSACMRRRRGLKNKPAEELGDYESIESSPEDQAAASEVARALEELPAEHRDVLLLRDVEGMTAPEAAKVLGVSVDALKSRLHRARIALRIKAAVDDWVGHDVAESPDRKG